MPSEKHAELVQRALRWLRGHHGCTTAYAELTSTCRVSPDAIGWRVSWSVLVEVKVSRADFKADRDKWIHRDPDSMPGQERWYLTPPGLVTSDEVPEGWGLAEAWARSIRAKVPSPRWFGGPDSYYVHRRSHAEIAILTSALRRHELAVPFDLEAGRFESYDDSKARRLREELGVALDERRGL